MRILITGGAGQLGRDVQRACSSHVVAAPGHAELDVADASAVSAAFEAQRPDAVVHCAALTDTTRCEREPALARAINCAGTENVAAASARTGAMLIAVSTNEVFDGAKREPYLESDRTGAVNAYGASKRDGEVRAMLVDPNVRIVRTSWLFGEGGDNFVEKVLAAARAGRELRFVTDEVATPTATFELARAIGALIEREAPAGIYHLSNEGAASRYEWAREIVRLGGFAEAAVEGVTTAELRASGYAGPQKPGCSALANVRARALGVVMPAWREALAAYFERAKVAADG
ncbi:MAG: dTDP-4-dehydrorhamnose reductase [Dehalococcoidia bacterium]